MPATAAIDNETLDHLYLLPGVPKRPMDAAFPIGTLGYDTVRGHAGGTIWGPWWGGAARWRAILIRRASDAHQPGRAHQRPRGAPRGCHWRRVDPPSAPKALYVPDDLAAALARLAGTRPFLPPARQRGGCDNHPLGRSWVAFLAGGVTSQKNPALCELLHTANLTSALTSALGWR